MKLEDAINKGKEILVSASYPITFTELKEAKPQPDGGWSLVYKSLFRSEIVTITINPQGEVISFNATKEK
ncbi:MAG: hypothetical protein M0Z41_20100 [Peptococcaceae bacterium]|jgi:hypothetical protein|nr:hypothetical protein [Peptococcaceae bacterium]